MIDDIGTDTSKEEAVEPTPAMRPDHGQVSTEFLRQCGDLGSRMAPALVRGYPDTCGSSPPFCVSEDLVGLPLERVEDRLLGDVRGLKTVQDHCRKCTRLDDMYGVHGRLHGAGDG